LRYDGTRWAHDDTLHTFDRVRAVCREVAAACEKLSSLVASAKTVAAVERLAKADRRLAATTAQWDADCWTLTCSDTTIDLRTGASRPADYRDYITKIAACACAPPGTPHPLWSEFLDRITDRNAELREFLRRYIGYCCTGLTTEHAFVFGYGTGANGKGTFINTIAGIFGEYATTAAMSTFLASRTEQHPTDLAKLCGARLVVAQETQKGRRWDETKIKALTGGDRITARFMRQDFFDYVPTFKLFICGNHKPRLSTVDEAMRRRLLLIPFTVCIPPAERDPQLAEKLKAEWPAILRWCVDGCLEWRHLGLSPPAAVREATEQYLRDQDTLQQWLEDCTQSNEPNAFTRSAQLFASWRAWCEERNLKPGSEQVLIQALVDKGYARGRDGKGRRGFSGLTIGTTQG
jgi:putative DNA primase/helicase